LLEILLNHAAVRRRLIGEIEEEDYIASGRPSFFISLLNSSGGARSPLTRAERGLDDEDLVQDLLPQLLVGDGEADQTSEPAENVGSVRRMRACMACAVSGSRTSRRACKWRSARPNARVTWPRVNELTKQKFELAKQERALAQLTGNGSKRGGKEPCPPLLGLAEPGERNLDRDDKLARPIKVKRSK